jgi:hypothetical protein
VTGDPPRAAGGATGCAAELLAGGGLGGVELRLLASAHLKNPQPPPGESNPIPRMHGKIVVK